MGRGIGESAGLNHFLRAVRAAQLCVNGGLTYRLSENTDSVCRRGFSLLYCRKRSDVEYMPGKGG